jgi:hypothetical protein
MKDTGTWEARHRRRVLDGVGGAGRTAAVGRVRWATRTPYLQTEYGGRSMANLAAGAAAAGSGACLACCVLAKARPGGSWTCPDWRATHPSARSSGSCRSGPRARGLAARLTPFSPSCGELDASASPTAYPKSARAAGATGWGSALRCVARCWAAGQGGCCTGSCVRGARSHTPGLTGSLVLPNVGRVARWTAPGLAQRRAALAAFCRRVHAPAALLSHITLRPLRPRRGRIVVAVAVSRPLASIPHPAPLFPG